MTAAKKGQVDCVKVLLEFGALLDLPMITIAGKCYVSRNDAIYTACDNGHFDVVKLLLETDPNAELNHPQYRPLYKACRHGNLEMAKLLIEHGAELSKVKREYGTNALMEASKSGNAELVEYLISKGAKIDDYDKHNLHVLLIACKRGHLDVMEVLLKHGAEVNVLRLGMESQRNTCLNIACQRDDMAMIRLLVKYKADMTVYNCDEYSPFISAYLRNKMEAIDLFLEHGVDLNYNENWACDKYEWTPLMYACDRGDIEMVKRLLAHGADVNIISQYSSKYSYPSSTALLVSLGHEEVLQAGLSISLFPYSLLFPYSRESCREIKNFKPIEGK